MSFSYSDITFNDKNAIKSWLQKRRLVTAEKLLDSLPMNISSVCDYGAGNGELCRVLSERRSSVQMTCYEPTPSLMSEAKTNLRDHSGVRFCTDSQLIDGSSQDVVFCLEVFEHLPAKQTFDAFKEMNRILKPSGKLIIGVPVETGIPALYKGIFRMSRRYGAFDATFKNIALSVALRPPKDRPSVELAPNFLYYPEHIGFDHRAFEVLLCKSFRLLKIAASPISLLGTALMPEAYFVVEKIDAP